MSTGSPCLGRCVVLSFFFLFLTVSWACAQVPQRTIVFTSEDVNVSLPQGMAFTFQTEAPGEGSAGAVGDIPPGQLVHALLDHPIKGRSANPGDPVQLSVVYPFRFKAGETKVSVPAKSLVLGHVASAAARDGSSDRSRLAVVLDRLVIGNEYWTISMKLVEIKGVAPFAHDPREAREYMRPTEAKQDAKRLFETSVSKHSTMR